MTGMVVFRFLIIGAAASSALAVPVQVSGGRTSVALNTAALSSAAGLTLSGISPDVIVPGNLPDSVAFGINPRSAAAPLLPTTFAYDSDSFLTTFSGRIEHAGSVFFNDGAVQVGNFTIGFDAARAGTLGGLASGFFVASTVGINATLFDVQAPSELVAGADELRIAANLLVSPELGAFLVSAGLASSDLRGVDVGDALVTAVPEPSALALLALGALALIRRR